MRRNIKSIMIIFLILYASFAYSKPSKNRYHTLSDHPRKIVSIPAECGEYTGYLLGLPAMVICLPVTVPLSLKYGDKVFLYAPLIYSSKLFKGIFGGLFWLFFGWWGQDPMFKDYPKGDNELISIYNTPKMNTENKFTNNEKKALDNKKKSTSKYWTEEDNKKAYEQYAPTKN